MSAAAETIAVHPRGPLDARVPVPGSRSIVNRALACAALADGESQLLGALESDDTRVMREGLAALGAGVRCDGDRWTIRGTGGELTAPPAELWVGASGTTARFLTAIAALAPGPTTIVGTERMHQRPIGDLADALVALGADVTPEGPGRCPPVRVGGGGLAGGAARIDASRSSQYVSAVLLAAPCAREPVSLLLADGVLVSRPYVELTRSVMQAFGVPVGWEGDATLHVEPKAAYRACEYRVEPDASSAAYVFAAAAIAGGRVRVEGIPPASEQADFALLGVLERMGCRVRREGGPVEVEGPRDRLAAVDADMNAMPDAVLALAVVALFADGESVLRNIANLRLKETDRLAALETELRRLGARAEASADALRVRPGPLRGARIETYDDHRMAMAFALAGLRVPGVEIADPGCVAKTWPDYFSVLERL